MSITRRFFPLLVVLFLLISCAPGGTTNNSSSTKTASKPTPTATPTPIITSPTPLPPLSAADKCPSKLSNTRTCITPHAMRMAYALDGLIQQGFTGKGQTIIDIVSFGSPTLQQDMQVYDQTFNLPPIDLQVISPLNVPEYDPHNDKGGWAGETTLDVEIYHALAPEAKIVVLTSPVAETEGTVGLPEFRQLEQYAIDHKLGTIVSQSWGASELTLQDDKGQQELKQWNDLFQRGTTQDHMTYISSSGDGGATDYQDDNRNIANVATTSFAPDSPWVTAAGGTALRRADTTFDETAWNGSGGGFSRFYQEPSYQKLLPAAVQQQFNNRRGVPDVSADADPATGLAIYEDGYWGMGGGTSAAAPVWAAIMAIANQKAGHPLGFINPALYKLGTSDTYARDFRDITFGDNTNRAANVKGYSAVAGWDPVTGLGSPLCDHLIPDLIEAMKS